MECCLNCSIANPQPAFRCQKPKRHWRWQTFKNRTRLFLSLCREREREGGEAEREGERVKTERGEGWDQGQTDRQEDCSVFFI